MKSQYGFGENSYTEDTTLESMGCAFYSKRNSDN